MQKRTFWQMRADFLKLAHIIIMYSTSLNKHVE